MKLGRWIGVGLVMLLLAAGVARGEDAPLKTYDEVVAALPHSDAAGQVVDKSGKPVAGADVFLYYQRGYEGFRDRLAGKTQTDAQGRFAFKGAVVWEPIVETNLPSPPKYDVIARDAKLGIAFTVFREGDAQDKLKITMNKPEYVSLTVKDNKGTSLTGVRVFLADGEQPGGGNKSGAERAYATFRLNQDIGLSSGVTTESGRLRLLATPGATYWAVKDGYAKGWYRNMTLFPGAEISGRVTGPDGKPIPDAPVWFNYSGKGLGYEDVAVTDKDGRYTLKNLPGKEFRFSWMKQDSEKGAEGKATLTADDVRASSTLVGKPLNFTIAPGDKLTKDLTMAPSALVLGHVVDAATGKPVAGMRMLRSQGDGSNSLKDFTTDRDGRFTLRYAPGSQVSLYMESSRTGDYILEEEQNGRQVYETTLSKPRTEVELKARIWKTGPFKGMVLGTGGKPQAKAAVYMHSDVPAATAGPDGAFTLKCAPRDRDFDLYAVSADKKAAALVHLKAGATSTTIRLAPTRNFTGKITTPDGLPADNLGFYFDLKINNSTIFAARKEPKTGADGTFKADGLCPQATYYAWWNADNETNRQYDWGNATVDLSKLKEGQPIAFEAIQFINTLMGKVQDEQGKPVAGAQIQVKTYNLVPQDLRMSKSYASDAKGNFTIERLGAGKVTLKVGHPRYKTCTTQLPSDSIDAVITLKPKGGEAIYKVQVVDEQRKPMAGTPVTLLTAKYDRKVSGMTTQTQTLKTGGEGTVEFHRKFPSGEDEQYYRSGSICCDLPGYDLAYGAIEGEEDADLVLVLRKSGECWSGQVVDEEQKPIASAKVSISLVRCEKGTESALVWESPQTVFKTDREGRYTIPRFGRQCGFSLTATAEGYTRENNWVDMDNNPKGLFTLKRAGSIKGQVRLKAGGQLLGKGQVYMSSRTGGDSGAIKADGTFTVNGLKSGDYTAQFATEDKADRKYVLMTPPTVSVSAGQTATVTLELEEGIPVQGKLVVAKSDKAPEGKAYISLRLKDGQGQGGGSEVEADGSWISYLAPGTYDVSYYIEGASQYVSVPKPIVVEKGKKLEPVVIEIK